AIAVPVEELDPECRQRRTAPHTWQRALIDGKLRRLLRADVQPDVDVLVGADHQVKETVTVEVHGPRSPQGRAGKPANLRERALDQTRLGACADVLPVAQEVFLIGRVAAAGC